MRHQRLNTDANRQHWYCRHRTCHRHADVEPVLGLDERLREPVHGLGLDRAGRHLVVRRAGERGLLVEDVGTVVAVSPKGNGRLLTLKTAIPLGEVALGASIAVDGVCLTAEDFAGDTFTVTAGKETLAVTTVGGLTKGHRVNLERALRVGDRLGGHLVQGHVDGVGQVKTVTRDRESLVVWVQVPEPLRRYVAVKGSITVDGVSLTVNELSGGAFRVNLIPHTVGETNLGDRRVGDAVNLGARLCSVAARGEVITSKGSRDLTEDEGSLVFEEREPVQVKGKSEPIQIFEVTRRESA